ncbi:MAG: hypothetical protein IH937_04470 [Acidobacteria bacterium]|nr:hypothetical protein [Acidobacteriota bacterium]
MIDSKDIKVGAYAGLTGGAVFGVMMSIMVGDPSAEIGFFIYLVIGAVIGAIVGVGYIWLKGRSSAHKAVGGRVRTLAELCMYNTLSKETDLRGEQL